MAIKNFHKFRVNSLNVFYDILPSVSKSTTLRKKTKKEEKVTQLEIIKTTSD